MTDHISLADLIRAALARADQGALIDVALHLDSALIALTGFGVVPPAGDAETAMGSVGPTVPLLPSGLTIRAPLEKIALPSLVRSV